MDKRQPEQDDNTLRARRGSTRIGDNVVSKIVGTAAGEVEGVLMGGNATRTAGGLFESVTGSRGQTRGVSVEVGEVETAIDLTVGIEYGKNIPQTIEEVRKKITDRVQDLTGLRVTELNVTVGGVVSTDREPNREEREEGSRGASGGEPGEENRPRVRRTSELRNTSEAKGEGSTSKGKSPQMDDDRDRREEEARREAEQRRGGDPLIDYEWHGVEEGRRERVSRGSRTGHGEFRTAYRQPEQGAANEDQQNYEGGDRSGGTYGSSIDSSNVVGAAVAEFIGTFILIYTGTAVAVAAILARPTAGDIYDSLAIALAFGIALTAIVAAIGHVSGGHVNPAVTLALAVTKKFPWQFVPIYIGAQLAGALFGAIATWITYGEPGRELALAAATIPVEGVGDLRALVVEILVTFILVFVIMSVATDDRAPAGVAPLAVGFALACGVFIAGPVTGGSLNPVRTLGPMIISGRFDAVWVYILGPIIGAILAAVIYDRFASQADANG